MIWYIAVLQEISGMEKNQIQGINLVQRTRIKRKPSNPKKRARYGE